MSSTSRRRAPSPPGQRGPGLFIPRRVIVFAGYLVLGLVVGALVWFAPALWPPFDAAIAVLGLSLTLYGLRRERRR